MNEHFKVNGPPEPDTVECLTHGTVQVRAAGSYTGYAGGRCYWVVGTCGCYSVEESNDVRAAQ